MTGLHPQLAADTITVARLSLCHVLLMQDANYPWLILVPDRDGMRDMHDLSANDQQQLMRELDQVSRALKALTGAHKMNVAALGNMVPQLHVHVIARFEGDAAWPRPVWGAVPAKAYNASDKDAFVVKLQAALQPD